MERKKIGLILSGGGERGWIQLGALEVMEKEKIPYDIIVGCSVGGIVGWGLAAGYSVKELFKIADQLKEKDVKKLSSENYAIFDPSTAFEKLKKLIGNKNIEDLEKKFAVVAVDLISGEEVVIDKGPALPAIRATTSIPALFPPVPLDGKLLVDGGVLNVLPVDVAYSKGADITIAIDVSEFGKSGKKVFTPSEKGLNPLTKRLIGTTRNPYLAALLKRSYLFESLYQSTRVMSARIRNDKLDKYPPTVLLEAYYPPKDPTSLSVDDKKHREKLVNIGKELAENNMDKIKNAIKMAESQT